MIATKVGMEPVDAGDVEGLSAAVIERESRAVPERLGVDVIDVYWAHGEDRSVPIEETVAAFGALVAAGAVGGSGVSNHPVWRVEQARVLADGPGRRAVDRAPADDVVRRTAARARRWRARTTASAS